MLENLIIFLQDELDIPAEEINLALRHTQAIPAQVPMQLWKYGLIDMTQLERIFDWLE